MEVDTLTGVWRASRLAATDATLADRMKKRKDADEIRFTGTVRAYEYVDRLKVKLFD